MVRSLAVDELVTAFLSLYKFLTSLTRSYLIKFQQQNQVGNGVFSME